MKSTWALGAVTALLAVAVVHLHLVTERLEVRIAEAQQWALYTGRSSTDTKNEVIALRKRIEQLESRPVAVLPPVGDWTGIMRK